MSTRSRLNLTVALVLGGIAFLAVWNPFERVDRSAWERDFDQLLSDLKGGYANREWLVANGRVKADDLERRIRSTIREARSNDAARAAIIECVDAWRDPHLRVEGRGSAPGISSCAKALAP